LASFAHPSSCRDERGSMTDKIRIRTSLGDDGKTPSWEMLVNNLKVCDLTYTELLEHVLQATSSLRWITEKQR
jgi:hypothetical protein